MHERQIYSVLGECSKYNFSAHKEKGNKILRNSFPNKSCAQYNNISCEIFLVIHREILNMRKTMTNCFIGFCFLKIFWLVIIAIGAYPAQVWVTVFSCIMRKQC